MALELARRQPQGAVFGGQGISRMVAKQDHSGCLISSEACETFEAGGSPCDLLGQNLILHR
jgi:hypothetical protein